MVGAVRVISVERGHDPRDFALVPFRGAEPLRSGTLAELLGIRRVVTPSAPGVLKSKFISAARSRAVPDEPHPAMPSLSG